MDWRRRILFALGALLLAIWVIGPGRPLLAQEKGESNALGKTKKDRVEGEVLLAFRPGTSGDRADAVRRGFGGTKIKEFKTFGIHHWKIPPGMTVDDAVRKLKADPEVKYAEPNYLLHAADLPNDPRFDELWGLHNTGQDGGTADADIDAPEAWAVTKGDGSVIVGIIDSGVDYGHPDLATNMWTNPGEIPDNDLDDDGNGYVDDIHGWDFVNGDDDPMDDAGHGTHVAGTIGAVGNNGVGVAGVSWNVKIMALKFLRANGSGPTSAAVEALQYATVIRLRGENVRLTSNSWGGGGFSQALYDAIQASGAADMLCAAAAGNWDRDNDASPYYPASYDLDNIIAVASTDRHDEKSSFSSYGLTAVDLAAPGSSILSTFPGNGYRVYNGTSMATPHVAGVAVLCFSLVPGASYQTVRDAILNGADPVASMSGITVTGGRLNACGALGRLAMVVCDSTPAGGDVLFSKPTDFVIRFSHAPLAVAPDDLTVNGTPAGTVAGGPDPTVYTFTFATSPVTAEGAQTMQMAAAAVSTGDMSILLEHRDLKAWTATFRYDYLLLEVDASNPVDGGTLTVLPGELLVSFNEPIDEDSVEVDDLLLSEGIVTAAAAVSDGSDYTQARYTIGGFTRETTVAWSMEAGAVTDDHGNPMGPHEAAFDVDFGALPFPGEIGPLKPAAALVHEGIVPAFISTAGDQDRYDLLLDEGQTVTLVVTPDAALTPTVWLDGTSSTAPGAGSPAILQTVSVAAGTHTITVEGSGTGAYSLRVLLNAAFEAGPAGTQDINGTFIALAGGVSRGAVRGTLPPTTGSLFYFEDFEGETLGSEWTLASSTADGRIRITGAEGTAEGSYALVMDRDPEGDHNLNEAILTLDLSGLTEAWLSFWHAEWNDEQNYYNASTSDGIALRENSRKSWKGLWEAIDQPEAGAWKHRHLDLVSAADELGVRLGSATQIRFSQFDDQPLPDDGRAWDYITIHTPGGAPGEDLYSFTAAAGDTVTLALEAGDDDVEIELLTSPGGSPIATGTAGAADAKVTIEGFPISSPGTYYTRVRGNGFYSPEALDYTLVVTVGSSLDLGANFGPHPWDGHRAQDLALDGAGSAEVLGHAEGAMPALADTRVLYYMDDGYSNPFGEALNTLGVLRTDATGYADFVYLLEDGGWDLVILLSQNWKDHLWVAPLCAWANSGGRAILSDCWAKTERAALVFGGSYTSTKNDRKVNQLQHPIWTGITDPYELADPGWRDFSVALAATDGMSIGTFPRGGQAILVGNGGRTILNGLASDTAKIPAEGVALAKSEILHLLDPKTDFYRLTLPAGAGDLTLSTSTPMDGVGQVVNELDPMLRLFDAGGTLLDSDDNSGGDSRNAYLVYPVSAGDGRTCYVEVAASGSPAREGVYLLSVRFGTAPPEPGIRISQTSGLVTTEGGGTDTFTVVLDTQPTHDVTIGLSSDDTTEGNVSPPALTFTSSNWSMPQIVTATGVDDTETDGDQLYSIVTGDAASDDPDYAGLASPDVSVTNEDDDIPGVTVNPTSGLSTTEVGGTDTFTVVLDTQPTADVTIGISSNDPTEGTASPPSLTFTPSDWNTPQTVTVTGVDDAVSDGDVAYTIVTGAAVSSDHAYTGFAADDVAVTNLDDDVPSTTTYPSSDVPKVVPDLTTVVSTLVVTDTATIADLDVTVSITHSRDSDLDVYLIAPDTTRVELFTDVGGGGKNFTGTVLDDEAAQSMVDGLAPFTGRYRPEGSLSALDGKIVNGTWKLELTDDKKKKTGTLNSWSITVQFSGGGSSAAQGSPTAVTGSSSGPGASAVTGTESEAATGSGSGSGSSNGSGSSGNPTGTGDSGVDSSGSIGGSLGEKPGATGGGEKPAGKQTPPGPEGKLDGELEKK